MAAQDPDTGFIMIHTPRGPLARPPPEGSRWSIWLGMMMCFVLWIAITFFLLALLVSLIAGISFQSTDVCAANVCTENMTFGQCQWFETFVKFRLFWENLRVSLAPSFYALRA